MSNIFDNLDKIGLEGLLNRQLKNQVDFPFDGESLSISEHGLINARTILDIGAGNGYFLGRLAKIHPDKKFVGIDPSKQLTDAARKFIEENKIKNVEIVNEICPYLKLNQKFDFIYSRLTLYYTPERESILKWAHSLLNDGGRMCVIDVDDSYAFCYPHDDAWYKVFSAIKELLKEKGGADREIGRKLPYFFKLAGFNNIKFEYKFWYATTEMTPQIFFEYWSHTAMFIHKMAPAHFTKVDFENFIRFLEKIRAGQNIVALDPMAIVSGQK